MKRSYDKFVARLSGLGLFEETERLSLKFGVPVHTLYDGASATSVVKARKAVYLWLRESKGKGNNEIARMFDRAQSGVSRLMGRE